MSSDEEDFKVNKASHKQLLSEINEIVKFQHIKKPKRSEPAIKNDEFHLVKTKSVSSADNEEATKKSDKKSVSVVSLANIVRKNESQKKISNDFQNTFKKEKVLKKPLEKVYADRVQRTIAYDSTKNKLSRWDAVVTKNKNADQLKFPLNQDRAFFKDNQSKELGYSQFRYKTKMIQEMEAIHNECFPKSDEPTISNEKSGELLTLEEMKERRKELAKLKMRESYRIAKKRLQAKIKSKKYHRLKKREDLKQKLKEFEELKVTNPEAALKELEKIEKQRIQERVNLRHKNTGTWAKNMKVRAQYDTTAKTEIEAQLALSRELTQKQQQQDSSDSESDEEIPVSSNKASDNPWLSGKNADDDEIFSGYRKFWEEKNANEKALSKLRKMKNQVVEQPETKIERSDEDISEESTSDNDSQDENDESKTGWVEEDASSSDNEDPNNFINDLFDKAEENINKKMDSKLKELKPKLLAATKPNEKRKVNKKKSDKPNVYDPKYLEFERKAQMGDIDEALLEGSDVENEIERLPPSKRLMQEIEQIKDEKKSFMRGTKDEIDPNSFLSVKSKHLITSLPKTQDFDDADEEDIEDLAAANKMSLAEAFENDDIIHDFVDDVEMEAQKSQIEASVLPGWGSWGGEGVKKKKKFENKNTQVKKKDRVIVNTTPHEALRKHLVSTVPFPFTTVKDFEASLRVPIGKDFIPSAAHSKLTMESVVTKAGQVIEPMDEDALVKKQEKSKRNFMKHKGFNKKPFVKKMK